ncbi:MAG: hypothetical protein AAF351_02045 [Pseudomonadota bacterium]
MKNIILAVSIAILCAACNATADSASDVQDATVIEIATFKLKDGVDHATFAPLDKAVEVNHVSQQPGFVSRETGYTEQGDWLVIVHWSSLEAADASMNSFSSAPAAAEFMNHLEMSTMTMTRYAIND